MREETWKKALDLALLLGKDSRYLLALGLIQKLEAFCAGQAAVGTKYVRVYVCVCVSVCVCVRE